MTIAELIAALSQYPPDARVVVEGYEGGYSDPRVGVGAADIGQGGNYFGDHDDVPLALDPQEGLANYWRGGPLTPVVVLARDDCGDTETPWPEVVAAVERVNAAPKATEPK